MARYTPNWMQNGTYPAQLDRLLLMDAMGTSNSCLLSGTGAFAVSQHAAGASMVLDIAPGRGMVQGNFIANQGNYEIFSDAIENVTIPTAPGAGQSRIDLVIAQVRDAFVDSGGFSDFIFTTVTGTAAATGSQVAPTAPADSMTLAQVLVGPSVTSIVTANITDSRPFTRGPVVVQTVPALAANQSYTVTHNLGTQNLLVQTWDAVTTMLVLTQVDILNNNQLSISVTAATPNALNCVIYGAAPAPTPVLASDLAPKAYVDARTPNLPAPVTSGTTIQSYTAPDGTVYVAKNGVSGGNWYKARDVLFAKWGRNAAYTTATGTTLFPFDASLRDAYGLYVTANNWMVAPVAGLYDVRSELTVTATATGQAAEIRLYTGSNGTIVQVARAHSSFANAFSVLVEAIVPMNAGDNLNMSCFTSVALAASVGLWTNYGSWTYIDFAYRGTG